MSDPISAAMPRGNNGAAAVPKKNITQAKVPVAAVMEATALSSVEMAEVMRKLEGFVKTHPDRAGSNEDRDKR